MHAPQTTLKRGTFTDVSSERRITTSLRELDGQKSLAIIYRGQLVATLGPLWCPRDLTSEDESGVGRDWSTQGLLPALLSLLPAVRGLTSTPSLPAIPFGCLTCHNVTCRGVPLVSRKRLKPMSHPSRKNANMVLCCCKATRDAKLSV